MSSPAKKLILFVAGLIAINAAISYLFLHHTQYREGKLFRADRQFEHSSDTIRYLFMGHSRVNRAINTGYIPGSYKLYGGGETNPYIYYRLKYILEKDDKRIETLIIPGEIGTHLYSPVMLMKDGIYWDQYLDWWEFSFQTDQPFRYLSIGIKMKLAPYAQYWRTILKLNEKRLMNSVPEPFHGAVFVDPERKLRLEYREKMITRFSEFSPGYQDSIVHFFIDRFAAEGVLAHETNLFYLQKIKALTEKHAIDLVFLKYPLGGPFIDAFRAKMSDPVYTEPMLDSIMDAGYGEVLDLSDIYRDSLHLYFDGHHMNLQGQRNFSIYLNRVLEQRNKEANATTMEIP